MWVEPQATSHLITRNPAFALLTGTGTLDQRQELWIGTQRYCLQVYILNGNHHCYRLALNGYHYWPRANLSSVFGQWLNRLCYV